MYVSSISSAHSLVQLKAALLQKQRDNISMKLCLKANTISRNNPWEGMSSNESGILLLLAMMSAWLARPVMMMNDDESVCVWELRSIVYKQFLGFFAEKVLFYNYYIVLATFRGLYDVKGTCYISRLAISKKNGKSWKLVWNYVRLFFKMGRLKNYLLAFKAE